MPNNGPTDGGPTPEALAGPDQGHPNGPTEAGDGTGQGPPGAWGRGLAREAPLPSVQLVLAVLVPKAPQLALVLGGREREQWEHGTLLDGAARRERPPA